jgi:aminomuconate-semialdehyde/2-hydroxymuconate-6-semialdehyde dehydrogenase
MVQSFQSFISGQIIENASALNFISSLSDTKKALANWSEQEIAHRSLVVEKISQYIEQNAEALSRQLSQGQNLPQQFIFENEVLKIKELIQKKIRELESARTMRSSTGVILILLPARLNFKFLIEMLSSALLAGNVVFVKASKKDFVICSILSKMMLSLFQDFSEKELPRSLVQLFHGEDEVAELMVSHPAINGIIFQGKKETADRINQLAQGKWKKLMLMSGYHNSALILPDAELGKVVPELARSCFLGMGQLRWNMSNILITEANLPAFEKLFVEELEKISFGTYLPGEEEVSEKAISQLQREEKRLIWQGRIPGVKAQPLVVRDLSHCSVLQQDCLQAPAVLISPVKYVHEMAKWANTGYYAQAAQIFGSAEKALSMAKKIDAGVIFMNNWYESLDAVGFGYKQSAYGILDASPVGKFFSDAKNLTI